MFQAPHRLTHLAVGLAAVVALACGPAAAVADGDRGEHRSCSISGPSDVDAHEGFRLCGPEGSRWSYRWEGPGITGSSEERCLSVSGLEPGRHKYTLRTRRPGSDTWRSCSFWVTAWGGGKGESCEITGPAEVEAGESFRLCGPDASGWDWRWDGEGISKHDDKRCIEIDGLAPGTYTYTLRGTRYDATRTCTFTVRVTGKGDFECDIDGPSTVRAGEWFELCGPRGRNLDYEWSGHGVPSGADDRCVTIRGLAPGEHEFMLTVSGWFGERSCRMTVFVEGNGKGGACPGELADWRDLLRRHRNGDKDDDKKDHRWVSGEDLHRVLECAADRTGDWHGRGERGLWKLLKDRDRDGYTRLRQQYAIALLNVCAFELDVRSGRGAGVGLDPATEVSCRGVSGSVSDVLAEIADLLGDRRDWDKHKGSKSRLKRLAQCLEELNRGGDGCREDDDEDDDGDKKDDLRASELESELDPGDLPLERAMPNPFTRSTRLQYAVERSGLPVEIGVYDLAGRLVRQLERGPQPAGIREVRWDGLDAAGSRVRPGMYFVRGRIGERAMSLRVMLLQ